ncbi:platelet endothelial cell adhesion molecule isoform X2 [Mixophyes fleayi]|uniref:platelet endothelial cell adhesion molecule isoform X2 n=1 Tax=Mixophyes fleayi TaxID=3061075 RepID=UPI003F4DEED8
MYLSIVLLISGLWSIHGQQFDFTINSIELSAIPSTKLTNGQKLELKCLVDFARSTNFELESTISFYKDDILIHNVTTTRQQEIYTIQKARVSNTGLYKCQVSVKGREKKSKELEVKVTKLSPPSIYVSKTEAREGDEVIVKCEALEEEPPMKFSFHKFMQDEIEIKETKTKISKFNFAEAKFELKEGENILKFKCDVKLVVIDEETSERSKSKTVTALAPFTTPKIEVLPSLNFTEGINMSVKCSIQRLPEEVTITLQKDSHIVNSSTTETLSYFQFATVKDMGNYTCKAEGQRVSKSSSVIIKVAELFPRPRLTMQNYSKNPFINEGDKLSLECSVSDLPPEVSNKLEYYFIVNKGVKRLVKKGEKFNLTAKESGVYLCELTISNITKTSDSVQIQVYAPVTKLHLKQIIKDNRMVVPGDTLELSCRSQSGTPPITYSLYRGKKHLQTKFLEKMEARFLVNVTKPNDSGQYQCQAFNRNEKSNESSNIVNITVIIPVEDVNLTIIPTNGEVEEGAELTLICNVKNGTLPINFQFYVKKGSEILLHNVTKNDQPHTSFEVPSFSKTGDGAYFCVASNRANKSIKSTFMEVKAILATWKKGIIGSFIFLIIVAAVAIVLYFYLDKKKKGKDIYNDKRTSKAVNSSTEKSDVEMKTGNLYVGNNEQNHDGEYTEVDDPSPHVHEDAVESNVNRIEEAPEANNHT